MTPEEILSEHLPQEPQAVEPQVEPTTPPEPQVPEVPQFDPSLFKDEIASVIDNKVGSLQETLNSIKETNYNQNQPEPTEEELMKAQIAEALGLKKMESALEQKDEVINKLEERLNGLEQQQQMKMIEAQIDNLSKQYEGFDEELIIKELEEVREFDPELFQRLNTPKGYEYIWKNKYADKVNKQPDPITPSETSGAEVEENIVNRFAKNEHTPDDIGAMLYSYLK